ncbi:tetratricopeptide repeat protein [Thermodesulfobacteriota bacterium]
MTIDATSGIKVSPRWPYIGCSIFCLILIGLLIPQLLSRYYYQQSLISLEKDNLAKTRKELEKSRSWLNLTALQNDSKRIAIAEGDFNLRRAEVSKTVNDFLDNMEEAEHNFRIAIAIQPLDVDGYTGLARATAALEAVYPFARKIPYPNKAQPVYEQLLSLMPANLYTHELITKYYYSNKINDKLQAIIYKSLSIYPPLYYQLVNQPFYTLAMNEMIKTSLFKAIDNVAYETEAYKALSDIAILEEDYQTALDYFIKTKPVSKYQDQSSYNLDLGRRYLLAGQLDEAEESFLETIRVNSQEKIFDKIWNHYQKNKRFKEFLSFCKKAKDQTELSEHIEILMAKCLIKMDQYELALSHLIRIDSPKYEAESFYLQARIAEHHKDWDTMELRSQRATVLDANNSQYHLLFSRSLQNQKKWPQAEQAATDAINSSDNPNPWLYNHRAWIRWNLKLFDQAQEDWEMAIEISPTTAGFYYALSLVYEQGGNIKKAIKYLTIALEMSPNDMKYKNKLNELTNFL